VLQTDQDWLNLPTVKHSASLQSASTQHAIGHCGHTNILKLHVPMYTDELRNQCNSNKCTEDTTVNKILSIGNESADSRMPQSYLV